MFFLRLGQRSMIPKKIPTEDTPAAGVMKSSKIVEE